ncbi:hypothetical protein JCGZ_04466 [Jatropha curcas]|uniref:DUF4408 domain-containing protein n=1 Tax=Jatropha curcas TaxID=180498 RepID=A0A067KQP4_JATCU|nr:uncharacterized protein LOC105633924 [Jatropha curcas]KDP38541.1 hypothetical protein JCGZ_04466 [Jatropha curcas]
MSSFEFDIVKAEKADAMRRCKRDRNCRFCLRAIGALSLLCCACSCLPVVQEMASGYFYLLNHKFLIFFIINALLFIVYYLSTNDGHSDAESQADLYDQYVYLSSSTRRETSASEEKQLVVSPAPEFPSGENTFSDKQLVSCKNVNRASMEENPVRCLAVMAGTRTDEKNVRRTQSEKYTIEKKRRSCRTELRRSETDNGRHIPARKSMQDMDSEEFRLRIERFIASRKKVLRDENVAVLMEERKECFTAITYV